MPNSANNTGKEPEPTELKAGHPPAVKVGNMRVTQRTHSTSSTHSDNGAEMAAQTAGGSSNVPSACSFAPKTVAKANIGGVSDSVANNPPQAEEMKHMHEKSQPTHDFRNQTNRPNMTIQQPRK